MSILEWLTQLRLGFFYLPKVRRRFSNIRLKGKLRLDWRKLSVEVAHENQCSLSFCYLFLLGTSVSQSRQERLNNVHNPVLGRVQNAL